jgi:hypothetical protein
VKPDDPIAREAEERLAAWLSAVDRVPDEEFTGVEDFEEISGPARADSYHCCDAVFSEGACPHDEALGPRHAFHLATEDTPDLLRHEYAASGLDVVVMEGRNFLLVRLPPSGLDVLALPAAERPAAIRRVAERLFGEGAAAVGREDRTGASCPPLAIPAVIEEGVAFSSRSDVDPALLSCWRDRIECGVRGGELYFVCYKKPSQRAGYANAQQWFDDEFRERRRTR